MLHHITRDLCPRRIDSPRVIDAEGDFYKNYNANPLRGLYSLSVEATEVYENAREAVRKFIGAEKSNEIIFTRNTTESLNLVAYSYGLSNVKKGDEIVVSIMEHHSDLLPWQMVAKTCGAELKFIECAKDGSIDLEKVKDARGRIPTLQHTRNIVVEKQGF